MSSLEPLTEILEGEGLSDVEMIPVLDKYIALCTAIQAVLKAWEESPLENVPQLVEKAAAKAAEDLVIPNPFEVANERVMKAKEEHG